MIPPKALRAFLGGKPGPVRINFRLDFRRQNRRNLVGKHSRERVVACESEMDVLKKNFLTANAVRTLFGEAIYRIQKSNSPLLAVCGNIADDFVETAVRAEAQRIVVTRQNKMLPGDDFVRQFQAHLRPAKLQIREMRVDFRRL